MKSYTFTGGVHPPGQKEPTRGMALESVFPLSGRVFIPLTQGGTPNTPLVSPGDNVLKGQKIAGSEDYMSVPVHASVSGTVKKIESRLGAGNMEIPCIVIEKNDSDQETLLPVLDPFSAPREEALERVREAGIVGLGGAAFPTHVKLGASNNKKIDTVLANGAECEPFLTVDERLLIEETSEIIDGLAIAIHITGAERGIICLESNKAYLAEELEKAVRAQGKSSISVQICKTKYPQGGERALVKSVLNREVPGARYPSDVGVIVQNVGTLTALSRAFRSGKTLTERALTIAGSGCDTPKNIRVPVGTLVSDLMPQIIRMNENTKKIISGGPMMGMTMMSAEFPIMKNTSGILFLSEKETVLTDESPCTGCGLCIEACPCRLPPVLMARALKAKDLHYAVQLGLMECIECGCCSYICPSRVRLVQRFRMGKMQERLEIRWRKLAVQKAEQTAATQGGKN